jgi:signal peptidase I
MAKSSSEEASTAPPTGDARPPQPGSPQSGAPQSGPAQPGSAQPRPAQPRPAEKPPETWRDTFEQIVLAFVLALVFRTFEAEAFVIPTGSMAPTLYGRNKEMKCESCGYNMVVGASSELTRDSGRLRTNVRIEGAVCPNCRYPNSGMEAARVFNGDRILVNKFPYELGDPDRWDVFVFKYPEKPGTNYIKRLVGLPGEKIRIDGGDLYSVDQDGREHILRKPPAKQRALQIPVYHHDFRSEPLEKAGWPLRWSGLARIPAADGWTDAPAGWKHDDSARTFAIPAAECANELQWLRYRHLAPAISDWNAIVSGKPGDPRPRLIGDFCGYNAVWGRDRDHMHGEIEWGAAEQIETGAFWSGDLAFSTEVTVSDVSADAELVLELCEGPWWHRARIDLATGRVRLTEIATHLDENEERDLASGESGVSGAGTYEISFANVDDRLTLWIDGSVVEFGEAADLSRPLTSLRRRPQWSDLAPVGLGVRGASLSAAHLELDRDVYYRSKGGGFDWDGGQLGESMDDPEAWYGHYEEYRKSIPLMDQMEIAIEPGHYLALGDNSPRSSDSRYWSEGLQTVPRGFLVGKAFWIYWPHGVPFLNGGKGYGIVDHSLEEGGKAEDYPLYVFPFYPDFGRMERIR